MRLFKARKYGVWEKVFAWFPVETKEGEIVWFEPVRRFRTRVSSQRDWDGFIWNQYERLKGENK